MPKVSPNAFVNGCFQAKPNDSDSEVSSFEIERSTGIEIQRTVGIDRTHQSPATVGSMPSSRQRWRVYGSRVSNFGLNVVRLSRDCSTAIGPARSMDP